MSFGNYICRWIIETQRRISNDAASLYVFSSRQYGHCSETISILKLKDTLQALKHHSADAVTLNVHKVNTLCRQ